MENRCFYLDKHHKFERRTQAVPQPGPDQVVVQIKANGICGSDVHFFKDGRLGNFVVEEPYIPGHECSGIIHAVGAHASGLRPGEAVTIEPGIPCGRCRTCLEGRYNLCPHVEFLSAPGTNGTLCDFVAVRADMVHRLPRGMDLELGAMVEPTAVAVHAVNMAGNVNGKTAVVFGAGPIGLLTMQAFRAAGGAKAVCVDLSQNRLDIARRLGADEACLPGQVEDGSADVVFETAGSPKATAQLFSVGRPGGTVVQVGWPTGNVVPLNVADLMEKELAYIGVNRYANAYPTAIAWLADGRINGKDMITHRYSFEQSAEAFAFAAAHPDRTIKVMIGATD